MVEKRVKKFGQGPPPPLFEQCPKEIDLFYVRSSLILPCTPSYNIYIASVVTKSHVKAAPEMRVFVLLTSY